MRKNPSQAKSADRRRHPRVQMGIAMDVRAHGHAVGKCRGVIEDLSVGGMAFKSNALLEEGATLYLKVNIPMEIRGEVRHNKASLPGGLHRYGVRFHKIGFSGEQAKPDRFIAAKFEKRRG